MCHQLYSYNVYQYTSTVPTIKPVSVTRWPTGSRQDPNQRLEFMNALKLNPLKFTKSVNDTTSARLIFCQKTHVRVCFDWFSVRFVAKRYILTVRVSEGRTNRNLLSRKHWGTTFSPVRRPWEPHYTTLHSDDMIRSPKMKCTRMRQFTRTCDCTLCYWSVIVILIQQRHCTHSCPRTMLPETKSTVYTNGGPEDSTSIGSSTHHSASQLSNTTKNQIGRTRSWHWR